MIRADHSFRFAFGLFLFLSVSAAPAQEPVARRYPIPDHGRIELRVPESWKDDLRQPPNRLPPTIAFSPKSGRPFEVLLTVGWTTTQDRRIPGSREMEQAVQRQAEGIKPKAVEQRIEVKELKGPSASGYYFSATDRAPAPGEYKYLTQGILRVADLVVAFSILTNDGQARTVSDALELLRNAAHLNN